MKDQRKSGGSMLYKVIPEEKVVCVWSEDAPQDEIAQYRQKGYRVAYYMPENRNSYFGKYIDFEHVGKSGDTREGE